MPHRSLLPRSSASVDLLSESKSRLHFFGRAIIDIEVVMETTHRKNFLPASKESAGTREMGDYNSSLIQSTRRRPSAGEGW